MTDLVRQEVAASADRIVVKVGSRVLTNADGLLDQTRLAALAQELAALADDGRQVVLVSSGAVSAGMGRLGIRRRPHDLAKLQATSAIGQSHLIETYDRYFSQYGRHAAQLLLTADGMDDRTRYLNVRNTILAVLETGAIPIINENDTVSVDELQLTFGDNDRLAAMVTNLIRAPLLVLLSDVEGLFDADPDDPAAQRIPLVSTIDPSVTALAIDKQTGHSKGGMASKLEAARIATTAGENVIIANGHTPGVLTKILAGEDVGTLFLPVGATIRSRKRWLSFAVQVRGAIQVDSGALKAIVQQGRSLLPIGIVGVEGTFAKGDPVSIQGPDGQEFARGLSNYTAGEITRIQGLQSTEIANRLGHCPYEEVVHRDNLSVGG